MLYSFRLCLSYCHLQPSTLSTSQHLIYFDLCRFTCAYLAKKVLQHLHLRERKCKLLLTIVTNAYISHAESHTLALIYIHICSAKM